MVQSAECQTCTQIIPAGLVHTCKVCEKPIHKMCAWTILISSSDERPGRVGVQLVIFSVFMHAASWYFIFTSDVCLFRLKKTCMPCSEIQESIIVHEDNYIEITNQASTVGTTQGNNLDGEVANSATGKFHFKVSAEVIPFSCIVVVAEVMIC